MGALGISIVAGERSAIWRCRFPKVAARFQARLPRRGVERGRRQQWLQAAIWDAISAICSAICESVQQGCGVPF